MALKDSPSSAKMAGFLVFGALLVLVMLRKGFAGIDVQLSS